MTPTESMKIKVAAINIMLQQINELPIETLRDLDSVYEARIAETVLLEITKDVLAQGWNFNTDENWDFQPDTTGQINLPVNVLDITADNGNVIMRDWALFNRDQKTFMFTEVQECTVIWDMDFNTLTHPLRKYITVRAARIYQTRMIGDADGYGFTKKEEIEAKTSAEVSDDRTARYTMMNGVSGYLGRGSL